MVAAQRRRKSRFAWRALAPPTDWVAVRKALPPIAYLSIIAGSDVPAAAAGCTAAASSTHSCPAVAECSVLCMSLLALGMAW